MICLRLSGFILTRSILFQKWLENTDFLIGETKSVIYLNDQGEQSESPNRPLSKFTIELELLTPPTLPSLSFKTRVGSKQRPLDQK